MDRIPVPLIMHVFPSFAVGGAQIRFAAIANHFGPAFRHVVVALDGNLACRERLARGLDVVFPEIRLRKHAALSNLGACRRLLRQHQPNLLITSNWGAIEWALANIPALVPHLHMEDGFGPEEREGQIVRRVLIRRLALRRSIVLLPSRTLLHIARDIWRLPPANLRYIPNGIDMSPRRFSAGPAPWPSDLPVIGTVAALRTEKNICRLLHVFHRLDLPARLVIVGAGPDRPTLERLSTHLGLDSRVHFTGHVAEPRHLYPYFDLFMLTSDTEQMPLSVLEAMAAGLPVVSTDVGDVRLMLAEENGSFVVRRTEEGSLLAELACCMRTMIGDPALRRKIGAANRARAALNYDQDTMFRAHSQLWMGQ